MTAVAMIFEMTLDYNIVLPTILAVAIALGTRRLLSSETVYTMKLTRRGHFVPKGLHANLFLVLSAAEVMETNVTVLDESTLWSDFMSSSTATSGMTHIVITKLGVPVGVLRVNTGLRRSIGIAAKDITMGELAQSEFVTVSNTDATFDVIRKMSAARAIAAVVVGGGSDSESDAVVGVITKDYIADAVSGSVEIFAD